jgi:hypothetical protein
VKRAFGSVWLEAVWPLVLTSANGATVQMKLAQLEFGCYVFRKMSSEDVDYRRFLTDTAASWLTKILVRPQPIGSGRIATV